MIIYYRDNIYFYTLIEAHYTYSDSLYVRAGINLDSRVTDSYLQVVWNIFS